MRAIKVKGPVIPDHIPEVVLPAGVTIADLMREAEQAGQSLGEWIGEAVDWRLRPNSPKPMERA